MPFASSPSFLALALLAASPEASRLDECETASPRIELGATPGGPLPVVCVSSGLSTTFRFDSRLLPESVKIQERERFEDVALGPKTLTVAPPENLSPGRRFEVEVCFADAAAPACTTFLLVAHPALGMQQVNVLRQPRSVAYYQQVADAAHADAQLLRKQVRQCVAERQAPGGLTALLSSELMGAGGVASKNLSYLVTTPEGNALDTWEVYSYRTKGSVAVEVTLENTGASPWTAAGAALRGEKGELLKGLTLWQPGHIPPELTQGPVMRQGRVVVELPATEKEARSSYTLTLWDADKSRILTLGNVTFP